MNDGFPGVVWALAGNALTRLVVVSMVFLPLTLECARSQETKTAPIAPATPPRGAGTNLSGDRAVEFQFGNVLLTLERRLILNQPNPRRLSREQWEATNRYEMRHRQFFELRLREILPPQEACGDFITSAIVMARQDVGLEGSENAFEEELRPTENPAVIQVITKPPPGVTFPNSNIDAYVIEDDSLRDYRGRKQSFIHAKDVFPDRPSIVRMTIRPHPEIRVQLNFSSFPCVLRQAVPLARFARDFFSSRIRSTSLTDAWGAIA